MVSIRELNSWRRIFILPAFLAAFYSVTASERETASDPQGIPAEEVSTAPVPPFQGLEEYLPARVGRLDWEYSHCWEIGHVSNRLLMNIGTIPDYKVRLTGDSLKVTPSIIEAFSGSKKTLEEITGSLIDAVFDVNKGIYMHFRERVKIPVDLPSVLSLDIEVDTIYQATVLQSLQITCYGIINYNAFATRVDEGYIKVSPGNLISSAAMPIGGLFRSRWKLPPFHKADYTIVLGHRYYQFFEIDDEKVKPLVDLRDLSNDKVKLEDLEPEWQKGYNTLLKAIHDDFRLRPESR